MCHEDQNIANIDHLSALVRIQVIVLKTFTVLKTLYLTSNLNYFEHTYIICGKKNCIFKNTNDSVVCDTNEAQKSINPALLHNYAQFPIFF